MTWLPISPQLWHGNMSFSLVFAHFGSSEYTCPRICFVFFPICVRGHTCNFFVITLNSEVKIWCLEWWYKGLNEEIGVFDLNFCFRLRGGRVTVFITQIKITYTGQFNLLNLNSENISDFCISLRPSFIIVRSYVGLHWNFK